VTDYRSNDPAPEKNATQARQGARGTPVLWVLGGGLALAIIAMMFFMSTSVDNPPPAPIEPAPVGPTSDAVPNNAEPTRIDAPPANPK